MYPAIAQRSRISVWHAALGAAWLAVLVAAVRPAAGQTSDGRPDGPDHGGFVRFDIPAQPLSGALNAYAVVTRVQLFVDSAVIAGRRSPGLRGVFTPEGGLLALLAGTGLAAHAVGDEGFTLVPAAGQARGEGPSAPAARRFQGYSARLQLALMGALCRNAETRPGGYRTVARMWLDPAGAVVRVALVTSTGDSARDEAVSRVLGGVAVGEPTPSGLPQPVTMLLGPGARSAEAYCPPPGDAHSAGAAP